MLELKFLPEENSVEEKEETRKVEVEEEVELSLTGNTHTQGWTSCLWLSSCGVNLLT